MANLIIKPTSGGSLILQDEGGTAAHTIDASGNHTLSGTTNNLGTITSATKFPAGHIIQVLQAVKTDTFSGSGTDWVDVTGLSIAITPSVASHKILVMMNVTAATQNGQRGGFQILRGSTAFCIADSASTRVRATSGVTSGSDSIWTPVSATFLDSPNTTSATTYKIQSRNETSGATHVNRAHTDADAASYYRGTSQITVMEVVA